ncbi:Uncharacterised protein [Vibrio cholerae]|nr:Uncharacterised protein [Vibrio cholerae]
MFPLTYRVFVNPKSQRTMIDESLIVLFPVVCFVTWFRHEATE